MVLDEFHVFQRHPFAVGERHAVAVLDIGVGRECENLARAARGQDYRFGGDGLNLSRGQLDRHHALAAAVIDQQLGDKKLIVAPDGFVLQRSLKQRVQHVEAGLVGGEPGALNLHAPEGPHRDPAIGLPAPGAAPVLQLHHLAWVLVHKGFHRVLVAQPVATGDRVIGVVVQAVAGFNDRCCATLGRNRVAAHRIDLGNYTDIQARIQLCGGDGGSQARAPTTHYQHITGIDVHRISGKSAHSFASTGRKAFLILYDLFRT